MDTLLTVLLILTSLTMIVAILLQSGKGSGLAAGFGGASAGTQVFGGSGAGGFLIKVTVVLGAVFMAVSLWMAYRSSQDPSAMSGVESTISGEAGGAQEEQIITRGSGPAPSAQDEPAPNAQEQPASEAEEGGAPLINLEAAEPASEDEAAPADEAEVAPAEEAEAAPAEQPKEPAEQAEEPAEQPEEAAPAQEEPAEQAAPAEAPQAEDALAEPEADQESESADE